MLTPQPSYGWVPPQEHHESQRPDIMDKMSQGGPKLGELSLEIVDNPALADGAVYDSVLYFSYTVFYGLLHKSVLSYSKKANSE